MDERLDAFQKAMQQGNSAAWDQMWDRAAVFYRQALDEEPDSAQALISLGLALLEQSEFEEALEVYQRAAEITPEDPIPIEKVAQLSEQTGKLGASSQAAMRAAGLYFKTGDVNKAVENWSLVTRLDPEHVEAHSRLAIIHERQGRHNQAVTEYLAVAALLQHAGKIDEAVQLLDHAMRLAPAHDQLQQAMTMLRNNQLLPKPVQAPVATRPFDIMQIRQLEAPAVDVEVDRDLDPIQETQKAAMTELARALFELSEESGEEVELTRRGLQEITRGIGDERDAGQRTDLIYGLRQAIDFQTHEQYEEAAEELEQVIAMGLDIPAIHFDLGYLYIKTGRLESGMRYLQRAVNQPDYALGARLILGDLMKDRGRFRDAALEYLEALKIADSSVVPPEEASQLRRSYEPLIEVHFQEANEEEHEQLSGNIAELLVRSDWRSNLEKARQELAAPSEDAPLAPLAEVLTQASSGRIVGALSSIHEHARNGHLRVAMDEAYQALDYAPTYLPLHTLMGDLLLKQERVEDAITKFTMVAKAYSSRGEAIRSRDLYLRILQLAPMDLETRKRLIEQYTMSGEVEAALQEYLELAEVHIRLAELETARQTYIGALRLAQQSNAGRKWSVDILHHIADIDLQRLDWRQAMRMYEQIRDVDPGDEKARRSLVDLILRMGQEEQALAELDGFLSHLHKSNRLDDALEMVQQLVEAYPDREPILLRLAQLYQQLGRTDEAVKVWDRIGDINLQAGNRSGAMQALQSIIALNPPNIAEYRQLMEELSKGQ